METSGEEAGGSGYYFKRAIKLVEKTTAIDDAKLRFFVVAFSKHTQIKDPKTLMYKYTLQEFLELEEYVAINNFLEKAEHMDMKRQEKLLKNKPGK